MRINRRFAVKAFACALIAAMTATSYANNTTTDISGYKMQLLKGCDIVGEFPMTQVQVDAYEALEVAEQEMEELENPIDAIEDQIDEYSDRIDELTELAIQEDEDRTVINKAYMAEQQEVVKKLNAFMKEHNPKFDALGEQGRKIGELARHFTKVLKADLPDLDYDNIRVHSPNDTSSNFYCGYQL